MIQITPALRALLPQTVYATLGIRPSQHIRAFHLTHDCRATGRRPESIPLRVALERELDLCSWCAKRMIATLTARAV